MKSAKSIPIPKESKLDSKLNMVLESFKLLEMHQSNTQNTLQPYLYSCRKESMCYGLHSILLCHNCLHQQHAHVTCRPHFIHHLSENVFSFTWKYFMSPMRSKASTIFLRSRLDTTAQGIRAVDTASNHSFNPSIGSEI